MSVMSAVGLCRVESKMAAEAEVAAAVTALRPLRLKVRDFVAFCGLLLKKTESTEIQVTASAFKNRYWTVIGRRHLVLDENVAKEIVQ